MATRDELMLHFRLNVIINEEDYGWRNPEVRKEIEFSIPADLFSSTLLRTKIDKEIAEAIKEYPETKLAYEAEEAAKKLAEMGEEEAEIG